jgi:hypothetical protein
MADAFGRWIEEVLGDRGLVVYDFPFGTTPDSAVSQGFVIRCTAPAAVNVRPTVWAERC